MSLLRDALRSYHDFCAADPGVSVGETSLMDAVGRQWGQIEDLICFAGGIHLRGWARADMLILTDGAGGELARIRPDIPRQDLQLSAGICRDEACGLGFDLRVRTAAWRLCLTATGTEGSQSFRLPALALGPRIRNRLKQGRDYLALLLRLRSDILRWCRTGDAALRHRIADQFRSGGRADQLIDTDLLSAPPWPEAERAPVTIIMPVYQRPDLLDPALERVRAHTDLPWHLVVIDDASSDPEVGKCLARWQEILSPERLTLLCNAENLGFVVSANRGLALALERGHDVVLLNSDALVGPGWAGRLVQPMRADRGIASVTPLSNEAEIATVPFISQGVTLLPGEGDAIDRIAARLAGPTAIATAPTGIGFCMAMNIDMLRRIPSFDTAFGRGYGEEVDWCQRAAALGGRNVLNAGVFVEHFGGASFGNVAKQRLIRENGAKISRRYRDYDRSVQAFITSDPLRLQRLILGLSFAAGRARLRGHRLCVHLGHTLGGGAEISLRRRIAADIRAAGSVVVIRPQSDGLWKIGIETGTTVLSAKLAGPQEVLRLFGFVQGLHIHYSCGVGAPDPLAVPRLLVQLAQKTGSTTEVSFNDFFPVSPSYTLLGKSGLFGQLPLDPADPAHSFTDPTGKVTDLRSWQEAWFVLLARAGRLTVFSQSSARIVAAVWPRLAGRIRVGPHDLHREVPRLRAASTPGRITIGVLGNINTPKGARILCDLSHELARSDRARLVLIGNLQPGFALHRSSFVTGSYDLAALPGLVRKYGISCWFFPSVWPETFSWVTHEMIATGLPVWCFDLGAQADAVRVALARGQGGGILRLSRGGYEIQAIASQLTGGDGAVPARCRILGMACKWRERQADAEQGSCSESRFTVRGRPP